VQKRRVRTEEFGGQEQVRPVCDTPVSVGGAKAGDNTITEDRRDTHTHTHRGTDHTDAGCLRRRNTVL